MINKVDALQEIIENEQLKIVFQPILSLKTGEVLGYEAFSRLTSEAIFKDIEDLFQTAKQYHLLWELEQLCRNKTLEAAKNFMVPPFNKKLFMNVYPESFNNKQFNQEFSDFFQEEHQISPHNITFEVSDQVILKGLDGVTATISQYNNYNREKKQEGMGTDLETTCEMNPDFIKIDMQMFRDSQQDGLKSVLVKGLVEYTKTKDISLIAEGIETEEEFELVFEWGVQYAQGYYIQKPLGKIKPIHLELQEKIHLFNQIKVEKARDYVLYTPIEKLISATDIISPDTTILEAFELMNQKANHIGLVVVDQGVPIGIVSKETLALRLSGRYGFTLYQDKPITKIMKRDFLSLDANTPVNIVGEMAMNRSADSLYDFVVVTEEDKYQGIVTIKTMLKKTFDLKVLSAKQANPLTGLPGNGVIADKLTALIESQQDYSVSYVDIDHFKPFNDLYGFENGDSIIKLLSSLLRQYVPNDTFIGHIGGDDFIIIFDKHIALDYFEPLIDEFEQKAQTFYNREDREKGYVETFSRSGKPEKFPLISLTAVTLSNEGINHRHILDISGKLTQLKGRAKKSKIVK